MRARSLPEEQLEALLDSACRRADAARTPFLDGLLERALERCPLLDGTGEEAEEEPLELARAPGGAEAVAEFLAVELRAAREAPHFSLVQAVAERGDSLAFEQLMESLDRSIRLRGLLFRHRLDPDQEYPALWGRIWEAIPKWDGRDFRAYVARIVRNYCLDELQRRKRTPAGIDEEPRDPRPRGSAGPDPNGGDALEFLQGVLEELESSGRLKPLDMVVFTLVCQGKQVAEILEAFSASAALPALTRALNALSPRGGRCDPGACVALQTLLLGLAPDEVSAATGRDPGALQAAGQALEELDPEARALARLFVRDGLGAGDLERARRLNANAINLCLNRIRLKVWMALVDRGYDSLRRRGAVDPVELAIVEHRCTVPTHAGCRMYKDRSCKREAAPEQVARAAGLDLSGAALGRRMDELRRKVLEEGLGMQFPDYNSCLNERKRPDGSAS